MKKTIFVFLILFFGLNVYAGDIVNDDFSKGIPTDLELLLHFDEHIENSDNIKSDSNLVDYVYASLSKIKEDFGEPHSTFDIKTGKISWEYKEVGLEFLQSEGFSPSISHTAICHGVHFPIIGGLFGDSTIEEYLRYFEDNGFLEEPEVVAYNREDSRLTYITPDLHYLFLLEKGKDNEPPKSVTITEVNPQIYSNSWQTFYVQQVLSWLGYDPGQIDSQFGQKTSAAITAFQKDHWMEENGVMDSGFVNGLNHLWNKKCRFGDGEPWYSAYETQLMLWSTSEVPDTDNYALVYVDDDEVPELKLMGRFSAQGSWFLTWHDGKLDARHVATIAPKYSHKKNIMLDDYAHMGYFLDNFYQIKNGEWICVASGEYKIDYEATRIEEINNPATKGVFSYTWEGTEVSEEEYFKHLKEYISEGDAKIPSITYDYQGILGTLWAGGPEKKDEGELVVLSWYEDEKAAQPFN